MKQTLRGPQLGLTLVELMVSLAIGLVVSLAAAALYLTTSDTSRASKAFGDINETGKIALDMIGREILKSGFFPAQYGSAANAWIAGSFFNGKSGNKAIFASGLYGCDGSKYDPEKQQCEPTVDGDPDSVVINYFSSSEFGATSMLGNANDCNHHPVADDADNAMAAANKQPMYVSNRFALTKRTTYTTPEGLVVTTRGLGCHGNGKDAAKAYEVHLQGVEDMVIRYGIHDGGDGRSPSAFLTAADVNAAGVKGGMGPWQRVVSVKICLLVRSIDPARTQEKQGSERTYRNCRGQDVKPASGDRSLYKTYERIYAVRNNINLTM